MTWEAGGRTSTVGDRGIEFVLSSIKVQPIKSRMIMVTIVGPKDLEEIIVVLLAIEPEITKPYVRSLVLPKNKCVREPGY